MWGTIGITGVDEDVYRALLRDPDIGVADCAADEHGSAAPAGDGGDRAQDRDRGVRQPLESENGHGRVSTLDTHDSSGRTPWRSS